MAARSATIGSETFQSAVLGDGSAASGASAELSGELRLAPRELELAAVLDALSDPIRLRIVAQLADGEEHTCGSFGLPITKSTCSHHLGVLRAAGVITQRVDGKMRRNRLHRGELDRRFPGLLEAVLRAYVS